MSLSDNHVFEDTFAFRMRVATYTNLGGVYLREIALPVSFEGVGQYHEIILDYLESEGVPDFQLERLKADDLRYTCPETRVQGKLFQSMSEVPDNAVLYYSKYATAEACAVALPPMLSAQSSREMLVTRDPPYLHLYFSGNRLSIPFPIAQDDFDMITSATATMRQLGVNYIECPTVATVSLDDDTQSPRQHYSGRRCLHYRCLELIGQWEQIPRALECVPVPSALPVHCDPRDALVPLPA